MPTVNDVLNAAAAENGYTEKPTNITKYWAILDPSLQGQPWCGAYVSYAFRQAGAPLPPIDKPYGFVYVPDAERWAKANGRWRNQPKPGFVAIYGTTIGVHTGIVATVLPGGQFQAWEGNTELAHDVDGGHVMLRTRGPSWVRGFIDFGLTEGVPPMFDPPLPVAAWCLIPAGVAGNTVTFLAAVGPDGAVYCEPGDQYRGGANGKPYFAGRRSAIIRPRPGAAGTRQDPPYEIEDTAGETYGAGGFG